VTEIAESSNHDKVAEANNCYINDS
jgi:hypothetical protein